MRSKVVVWALALLAAPTTAEDPATPKRILFLGDSLHAQFVQAAAKELGGQVKLHIPRAPVADHSAALLAHLDDLLGDDTWDLIYFNVGIGDLTYHDPKTKEIRLLGKGAGGVRIATEEQYAENLDRLAKQLKATGAPLIWATTTPLANVGANYRTLDVNSEIPYNRVAVDIMDTHRIPVVDLHAVITESIGDSESQPRFDSYQKHFSKAEVPPHRHVTMAIRDALGLKASP